MKHCILKAMFIVCVLTVISIIPQIADADTEGYYTYSVSDGEATITDFSEGFSGNLTVPATLGNYPVTAIGQSAFGWCKNLTGITLPAGLVTIGDNAFYSCTSLKKVTINGCVKICDGAFSNCTSLTDVTLPYGLEHIGISSFYKCGNLKTVTFPDTLKTIGYEAFFECTSLTSVKLPDSVTFVDGYAFRNCYGIEEL